MLGQLSGQDQADSGLDVPGGDGSSLPVLSQLGGLSCNLLEDVVGEGVHDAHGLAGDASVRVDLFENLVDESGVGLLPLLSLPLGSSSSRTSSLLLDRAGNSGRSVSRQLSLDGLLGRLLSRHLGFQLESNQRVAA